MESVYASGNEWNAGLTYRSVQPDGTVVERIWQPNTPYLSNYANPYVKTEFTSIKNAAGQFAWTAIKDYNYDKNGNVTQITEYDWVPYGSVPRDTNPYGTQLPTGIPSGLTPKRVTATAYNAYTQDASSNAAHPNTYTQTTAPRLLNAPAWSEVRDGNGTPLTRAEMTYDNPFTTGNLTQQRSWDSAKGEYSNPLSASNSIAVTTAYNAYGMPTLTTDARGTQTQIIYGSISGYVDLYPTQTIAGYGTPLARTSETQYDFWTGAVTQTKDVENNLTSQTDYDALGRPTLVKAAVGTALETHSATIYYDAARRVVTKSDLNAVGDGKIVAVQHYDPLGRVRLTRQLENPTDDVTNETLGVKVQTRYLTANPYTYALSSNPYRAAYSYNENTDAMGWTLSTSDQSGKVVRVETFSGAGLPEVFGGSNTNSSGAVTTAYDANHTTVSDQTGRQRRSVTDALGRLVRVDEPDKVSGELGGTSAPVQPTAYGYDVLGNLTTVRQGGTGTGVADYAGGQTRTFAYSSLSRLLSATNPESGTISYAYDDGGNLLTKTDARGVTATYAYDALSRNTQVNYSDGTPTVIRRYDPAVAYGKGKLWQTETANTALVTVSNFDALGRPATLQQQFWSNNAWSAPYAITREYDLTKPTKQTYPSGHTTNYAYDAIGRLASFTGNLGDGVTRTYAHEITYDAGGRLARERYGTLTPLYHQMNFNARGQMYDTRLGTGIGGTDRGNLTFNYSPTPVNYGNGPANNGNLLQQQNIIPNSDTFRQDYDYDKLNRLASVNEYKVTNGTPNYSFTQAYVYDVFGNRTINQATTTNGIPKPNFACDTTNNRLLPGAGMSGAMSYDNAGNLVNDTASGSGARVYDAENRMKEAWAGAANTGTLQGRYTYDGDGRRIIRTANGVSTWQVYGFEGELVAEYSPNFVGFVPQKEYGYQGGKLLVTATNGDEQRFTNWVQNAYFHTYGYLPAATEIQAKVNSLANAGWQDLAQLPAIGTAFSMEAHNQAETLFASATYANRNRSPQDYVRDLYAVYLQRPADPGGLEYWAELAAYPANWYAIRQAFADVSGEFGARLNDLRGGTVSDTARTDQFVDYLYLAALNRNVDAGALDTTRNDFNTASAKGQSDTVTWAKLFAKGLFNSQEYLNRGRTPAEFVYDLYIAYLRYEPDYEGWQYWTDLVGEQWQNKQAVIDAFAGTDAFETQAKTLYREMFWLIGDHLGTPRLIAERTGKLEGIKRDDYLPFGESANSLGGRTPAQGYVAESVRQGFGSYEEDTETGLDYAKARYYASQQGRFTSPDNFLNDTKAPDPASWNLYVFVRNNPLKYVDGSGQTVEDSNLTEQQREWLLEDFKKKTGFKVAKFTIPSPN